MQYLNVGILVFSLLGVTRTLSQTPEKGAL